MPHDRWNPMLPAHYDSDAPGTGGARGEPTPPKPEPADSRAAGTGAPEGVALIDIEAFFRTKLRVAKVLCAERVPKADRLLRLDITLGDEERQIVAGIAEHYTPEQMVGRLIVVVANLQPARIRGLESRGMLLAAKAGKDVRLVGVDGEVPPGTEIG
jgi:methionyl-tRNA synthetase